MLQNIFEPKVFSDNRLDRFSKFEEMLRLLKPVRSLDLQRYQSMKKIIVDCDPGVDDAYALQFLFNSKNVEIKAITT